MFKSLRFQTPNIPTPKSEIPTPNQAIPMTLAPLGNLHSLSGAEQDTANQIRRARSDQRRTRLARAKQRRHRQQRQHA
jgi:hypothetical protein